MSLSSLILPVYFTANLSNVVPGHFLGNIYGHEQIRKIVYMYAFTITMRLTTIFLALLDLKNLNWPSGDWQMAPGDKPDRI